MNQKEFDRLVKESMDKYNEKEAELDALLEMAEKKSKELEDFRDDLLLNLIHEDISSDEDDDEEEHELVNTTMKFMGECPTPEQLANSHSVVVHIMPGFLDEDGKQVNADKIYISHEEDLADEEVCGALGFALAKAFVQSAENMAEEEDINERLDDVDYDEVVDETMNRCAAVIAKQMFMNSLGNLFSLDDEKE